MERLVLRGRSKEDMKLIADVARKMGIIVEYAVDDEVRMVEEPEAIAEWEQLSPNQQQGILDAIDELDAGEGEDSEDVIKEFRKKYD